MPTVSMDQEIVAAHRLDLIEGYQAVTAEYEYLRDILRGKRPLDDILETSPLDNYLGCAPVAVAPMVEPSYDREEDEEEEDEDEPSYSSYEESEDDLPSGRYATGSAESGAETVNRRFSILGRDLAAEIEDDGWVIVVPAEDRLAEPLLSGRYHEGRVLDVTCALPPVSTQVLVSTVEALFAKALTERQVRRGDVAMKSKRVSGG